MPTIDTKRGREGGPSGPPISRSTPARLASLVGHPVRTEEMMLGGTRLVITRPVRPEALCDTPRTERRFAADEYLPYWADLWPAAELLATYVLAESPPSATSRALEIGCGLGLVAVAAARAGWAVLATDYEPDALHFTRHNARGNHTARVRTAAIDWRRPALSTRFERILAADVLYERRWHKPVADLVANTLAPGGQALIADPRRQIAEPFVAQAGQVGLAVDTVAMTVPRQNSAPMRGVIHRLRHL